MNNKGLKWTSVLASLPDYEREVIARLELAGMERPEYVFCHRSNNNRVIKDEQGFTHYVERAVVTHWMYVEDLERLL